ncbi:MAG: glycosyltransferase family 4 protein, partial [Thermoanaerobaculia bacterium]
MLRLIEALERPAIDPVVLIPEEGPLRAKLQDLGVAVRVQPLRWWIPATHWSAETFLDQLEGLPERCDALTREVESLRPDLIHTNTVVSLEGAVVAARTGLPHVWHSRGLFGNGFPPPYLDDVPFFYGVIDRLADTLVCVSQAVEREASLYGRYAERVVVPDGFDVGPLLKRAVESRESMAARLELEPSARLVVALGGIQRRKGQKDLVEAAGALRAEFPNLVVVLAGEASDSAYAAQLQELIRSRDLGSNIRLVGFQQDVRSLLAHADVFVHPSLSEGFALAVLEAMAVGVPVVATKSGGPEGIIEDGTSGLLVEPGAPAELARAIRLVLSDPGLAARLRRE